ncbi:hypothetical protein M4I21_05025 [Cellulophaga sp. 20_2_10]|uniref:hypothetical protein n=1 Tax=Cellulophaga sp. 20_2_10 TaxID=2942476 RepID=UPI00201ABEFE|nr:hypothetical protein [Cellulophaga sp. 20_2_10]MCL5245160.1 hypothetical protein [Cellulophaga sp. 20_2_10]
MKKIFIPLCLLAFSNFFSSYAQGTKKIDAQLEEAKAQMIASISKINDRLLEPTEILQMGVSDDQGLNAKPYFFDKSEVDSYDEIRKDVDEYLGALLFSQMSLDTRSQINIKGFKSALELKSRQDDFYSNNNKILPEIIVKKLFYKSGEVDLFKKDTTFFEYSADAYIKLENGNPIDSIEAEIKYLLPENIQISINKKEKKYFINNDSLVIQSFENNSFSFYASENVYDQIREIQGVYKDGKLFEPSGSSKFSVPVDLEIEYLKKFKVLEEKAIKLIDANTIKNMDELRDYFEKNAISQLKSKEPYLLIKYVFAAKVEKINLFINNQDIKPITKKIIIRNKF